MAAGFDLAHDAKDSVSRQEDQLQGAPCLPETEESFVSNCLAGFATQPIRWLWGEMVARGVVTSLTGDSGIGKSFVGLDVAAAVTRGDAKTLRKSTADETAPHDPGDVLLISADFQLAEVIQRRLTAAGTEMSRVHALRGIRRKENDSESSGSNPCFLSRLNKDLSLLEQEIEKRKAVGSPLRLVVIDPFPLELFDGPLTRTQLHQTILRLNEIAATGETAILRVMSCPENPRARVTQNIKMIEATVQSAWWIGRDPYQFERRVLLPVKMNLARKTPGRTFFITEGRVEWNHRPIRLTAERFHKETKERLRFPLMDQEFSELAHAINWLREFMGENWYEFKYIKETAAFSCIGERTLRRAFCALKGISWRMPRKNVWAWKLREQQAVDPDLEPSIDRFLYDDEYSVGMPVEQPSSDTDDQAPAGDSVVDGGTE